MSQDDTARIVRLGADDREVVIDVLFESFRTYPVMEFVLGSERGQPERLRSLVGFFADVRFTMGWPVLGVQQGGRLVAAMLANEPHDGAFLDRFQEGLDRVRRELGEAAFTRLERFEKASEGNEPQEPHFFVGMLGVLPEEQGRGHARMLLEYIRDRSVEAGTAGVALSTEDPKNLPFYQHMGFKVIGKGEVDDLSTWALWWPNR